MDHQFIAVVSILSLAMLIWACIEVGSNDATNLVNAVFGARVLGRKPAIYLAGIFVILGATYASPVMDTVRKGIFDISLLNANMVVSIFISAYLVNTVLLFSFSGYGLPISTTASLVFALAGGAIGASGGLEAVNWPKLGQVTGAILLSIILSGIAGFLFQRIFRGAMRKNAQKHDLVMLHGPWITGILISSLFWFMIVKGMKSISFVKLFKSEYLSETGTAGVLFILWAMVTLLTHIGLRISAKYFQRRASKYLFHMTAILGMCCMAFAFGQNDLANAASPGLGSLLIWKQGLAAGSKLNLPFWALAGCGFLMFIGMLTKRAQRVTRAEVNTASQQSKVKLYAPKWCVAIARKITNTESNTVSPERIRDVAPDPSRDARGKKIHYDALRASVILAVSASVIAFASGMGLPVSTTYVAFAAVIATGWGDRVFSRGGSDLKMGRAIWVVTCWFLGGALSAAACGILSALIYHFQYIGLAIAVILNGSIYVYFKRKSDSHEAEHHKKKNSQPKHPGKGRHSKEVPRSRPDGAENRNPNT